MKNYHLKIYLDMIRPNLRDFINDYKPTTESNNEESEENEENDSDADRADGKFS